jgi:hypothetical protein
MIIYGNNSKISPLSLPFQVPFFFFPFPNHQPQQIPFLLFVYFFPSLKILDKRVRVILSSLLSWCWWVVLLLVQGNSVFFIFLFMHDHHHLVIFLLGLFWNLGFWRKFWVFLLSDTNTNLDLKDSYLSWNHSVIQVSKIFWSVMKSKLLIKWFAEMAISFYKF